MIVGQSQYLRVRVGAFSARTKPKAHGLFWSTDDTIYHPKSLSYEVELLTADGSVSEVDATLCLAYDADGGYGNIDSSE